MKPSYHQFLPKDKLRLNFIPSTFSRTWTSRGGSCIEQTVELKLVSLTYGGRASGLRKSCQECWKKDALRAMENKTDSSPQVTSSKQGDGKDAIKHTLNCKGVVNIA